MALSLVLLNSAVNTFLFYSFICAVLFLISTFHLYCILSCLLPSLLADPLLTSSLCPIRSFSHPQSFSSVIHRTCSCITYISLQKFCVKCPLSCTKTHTHTQGEKEMHMKEEWTWNTNYMTNCSVYTTQHNACTDTQTHAHLKTHIP